VVVMYMKKHLEVFKFNNEIDKECAALLWGGYEEEEASSIMMGRELDAYHYMADYTGEKTEQDFYDMLNHGDTLTAKFAAVDVTLDTFKSGQIAQMNEKARDIFDVLSALNKNPSISMEELKRLAEIREERPKFLFPESVTTVEPQSSELADLPYYIKANLQKFIELIPQAYAIKEGLDHGKPWKSKELPKAIHNRTAAVTEEARVLYKIITPPKD